MNISQRGLNLIYEFEGKLTKLPDGRYQSYRCPAGVWTIYAGCTDGVHEGMIVTEQQGEMLFRNELAKFERCVTQACTREPNQNQFDAFVSLAYNIGEAGFRKSSVLRHFNAGRDGPASRSFAMWNKGGGRVLKGLVRRRTAEAGLFMRPMEAPPMPQKVETNETAATATGSVATIGVAGNMLIGDPVGITTAAVALKGNMTALMAGVDLVKWGPPIMLCLALALFIRWARKPS